MVGMYTLQLFLWLICLHSSGTRSSQLRHNLALSRVDGGQYTKNPTCTQQVLTGLMFSSIGVMLDKSTDLPDRRAC